MSNSEEPGSQSLGQGLHKGIRQTQYIIGLSYCYDSAMLFGFFSLATSTSDCR